MTQKVYTRVDGKRGRQLAYRGKEGCDDARCTRQLVGRTDNDTPIWAESCYGWHCPYCHEACSYQGHDCPDDFSIVLTPEVLERWAEDAPKENDGPVPIGPRGAGKEGPAEGGGEASEVGPSRPSPLTTWCRWCGARFPIRTAWPVRCPNCGCMLGSHR